MSENISTERLRKNFILYLTGYMLLASLVIAAIAFVPLTNYIKDEVKKSFLSGAIVRAVAIDERLDKMIKIAEQTSKRFGILSQLDKYAQGHIDLDAVVAYVEPRHRLVMVLSPDITGISQFDARGHNIVALGTPIPQEFIQDHFPASPIAQVHIHNPNLIGGTPQFMVHVPQFNERKDFIGASYVLFTLEQFRTLLVDSESQNADSRFFLGTLDETQEENKILLNCQKCIHAPKVGPGCAEQMLDQVLHDHGQEARGLLPSPQSLDGAPNVAAFVKLKQAQLVLLGKRSEANLYKQVDRFTGFILSTVAFLILAGTAGMFFLSRPLTGRVLIYSNELEELNQSLRKEVHGHQEAEDALTQALQETKESRNRVNAIVHSVPDALMVIDPIGRMELLNPAAERLLNLSTDQATQKPLLDLLPEKPLQDAIRKLLAPPAADRETILDWPTSNGGERAFHARISALHENNQGVGQILLLQDVTRQRHIEQMKSEFISTAAHELRTPMTIIMGFSELLTSRLDIPVAQQQEYLSYILQKSEDMSKILDDLLDISRIESGRAPVLHIEPLLIGPLIEQAVIPYRQRFTQHRFETALQDSEQIMDLDGGKFAQVMENLLSNAVKYSAAGSLVRIGGELREDHYLITVSDQGIGMTAEQAAQVFDKFYRADASNTAAEGTGLGMFIVRHIVQAHGGKIWLDSTFGRGTTIYLSLPLHPPTEQAQA